MIGVDANAANAQKAMDFNIVDEVLPLIEAVEKADIVVLAVPVSACEQLLPQILEVVDKQVVIDTGSTKKGIIEVVKKHPKEALL